MAASSIVEMAAAEAEPPAASPVTKVRLNKEEAGTSSDDGIGVTKEEAYISGVDIGITKAVLDKTLLKTGVVAEPKLRAWLYKFAEGSVKVRLGRRFEPVVPPVTMKTVRMPDAYIESIKRHPMRKIRPLHESIARGKPKAREFLLDNNADLDYMVDLQQDCLRQHAEKGYAEVGIEYTDDGLQKRYILPHQPQVTMTQQQGNAGGGRMKTTLVFAGGFAILFALLAVLLSFLLLSRVSVQV